MSILVDRKRVLPSDVLLSDSSAQAARDHWNTHPCGDVSTEEGTAQYFHDVSSHRYFLHPWLGERIDELAIPCGRVLEIGHGIGTDLVRFAQRGMQVSAVDLSKRHHDLATRNLARIGATGDLHICDASKLPFPTASMDLVYSFGVMHHMNNPFPCVDECRRVLKPGGKIVIGLYYRYSAFHVVTKILLHGLLFGGLFRLGYRGLLATVEEGADGLEDKPFVHCYSKKELRALLSGFTSVETEVTHFRKHHLGIRRIYERFPDSWLPAFDKRFGWYVIGTGIKT